MRYFFKVFKKAAFLWFSWLLLSSDLAAGDLSFQELARHIHDRRQAVRVLRTECSWKVLQKGVLRESFDQTLLYDDLGRFRETQSNRIAFGENGKAKRDGYRFQDRVYNGEKTCRSRHFPFRDQSGRTVPEDSEVADRIESDDSVMGYRNTVIDEGIDGQGINAVRRPFEHVSTCFTIDAAIDKAVKQGLRLPVHKIQEHGRDFYKVIIPKKLIARDGPDYEAIIDPSRGWVFSRSQSLGKGRFFEASAEYPEHQDGIWFPASGSTRAWFSEPVKNRPPDLEVRYVVNKVEMNFPVEDSAFSFELDPKTWVVDTRFGSVYRTGQEKVFDADLTRLAQAALEKKKQATDITHVTEQRSWRGWIIAANVGVVLLLLTLVVLKKLRTAKVA